MNIDNSNIILDPYINKHAIMGMLSKGQTILDDNWTIRRNKSKIFCFSIDSIRKWINDYKNIGFGYMDSSNKLLLKNEFGKNRVSFYGSGSTSIISHITENNIHGLGGKEFKEHRETVNSLNRKITIKENPENMIEDVNHVVKKWEEIHGKEKYGWQLHSGYDRHMLCSSFYEEEKNDLQSLFFYNELDECVGYSIISKKPYYMMDEKKVVSYIIRKYIPDIYRNLCLYIDLKTLQRLQNYFNGEFLVSWGSSSGMVLNYKRNKFKRFLHKEYGSLFGKVNGNMIEK